MYTAEYVQAVLESAGKTLAMYPSGFGRPRGYISAWPEVLRELVIVVTEEGPEKGIEIILPDMEQAKVRPSLKQVTELEMICDWIVDLALYCKERKMPWIARTVWIAMLHHPVHERRLMGWRKIGKKLHVSHETARRWYGDGIEIITKLQNAKPKKKQKKI
jgi:hypothetical protein